MRQRKYLNVILTVNALLLAALTWTQIAATPLLASEASADTKRPRIGVPNAAAQRQDMIRAIRDLQRTNDETRRLLESGKIKVQVTNLGELKAKSAD